MDSDGRGIVFPIETWRTIFANLYTQPSEHVTRDMLSLAATCTAFQYEAELILYHNVRLTRGIAQLNTFLNAITQHAHRAQAVFILHLLVPSRESRSAEDVAKSVLEHLPNLRSLYIDPLEDPHDVLAHSPSRLRTLEIDGDAFVCLHLEERRRLRKLKSYTAYDVLEPFTCEVLSELTTLTIVDISIPLSDAFKTYSAPYNITHLNIISSPIRSLMGIIHALADKLVSLRIYPALVSDPGLTAWLGHIETSGIWPTTVVANHVFPRLKYLEVDEDNYNQASSRHKQNSYHVCEGIQTDMSCTEAANDPR